MGLNCTLVWGEYVTGIPCVWLHAEVGTAKVSIESVADSYRGDITFTSAGIHCKLEIYLSTWSDGPPTVHVNIEYQKGLVPPPQLSIKGALEPETPLAWREFATHWGWSGDMRRPPV